MKIIIDNQMESPYHQRVEIEGDGEDIWAYGEIIKQALLGLGFHPNNIKELFNEEEE
jgi:hypothetical protein